MPNETSEKISKCGDCVLWRRTADRYLQNGHKGELLENLFPYCHDVNNHMPYDAEPECIDKGHPYKSKPPYRIW